MEVQFFIAIFHKSGVSRYTSRPPTCVKEAVKTENNIIFSKKISLYS